MPKITVLKPFVFSRPPSEGQKLATEQRFDRLGEVEIDDAMAAHPWITTHFADGAIESPQDALAKAEAARASAEQAAEDAKLQTAAAEAALKRAQAVAKQTDATNAATAEELNKPANEVAAQSGEGVDSPTPASSKKK